MAVVLSDEQLAEARTAFANVALKFREDHWWIRSLVATVDQRDAKIADLEEQLRLIREERDEMLDASLRMDPVFGEQALGREKRDSHDE